MIDLSVELADLDLNNPILVASGPATKDFIHMKKCVDAGAAAVVTKTVVPVPVPVPSPRLAVFDGIGMQNIDTFSEHEVKIWIEREISETRKLGVPIIVSIASGELDKLINLAKTMEQAEVDMIELNLSCPHALEGRIISADAELTESYVKQVKEAIDLPVMPKLTPNVTDIAQIAGIAETAGADAISAINTIKCLIGVDINLGKAILPTFGGYSGPAIKPIALRCIAEIASLVKIPVSGIGGIMSWKDVIEMLMIGATTVQLCTAIMWRGYKTISDIISGVKGFMERNEYSCPKEFIGRALENLVPSEKFYEIPTKPLKAFVNKKLCTGCGLCMHSCFCDAIYVVDGVAEVESALCDGCGLCAQLCPRNAVYLAV